MTSLDKALIKVYEQSKAPQKRRVVETTLEAPARELYVDPPVAKLPSPAIAHQVTVEDLRELIPNDSDDGPIEEEDTNVDGQNYVLEDMAASLDSFVVHQEFDIPVLEEISTVVADSDAKLQQESDVKYHAESDTPSDTPSDTETETNTETNTEITTTPHRFTPAWEVDAFELPNSTIEMNGEIRPQLNDFAAHLRETTQSQSKLITVHSQSRGEGRTTLSITLAITLAQTGANVLLVDADFQNPALANRLGLAVETGWESAIAGEVPIAECSVRSIEDRFTILPLSDAAMGEDHSILRDALGNLLSELMENFDLILIDAAPGQPILGESFENMIATRIAVRDVRRTDSRLMLQFMKSLKTNAGLTVEAVDNFA